MYTLDKRKRRKLNILFILVNCFLTVFNLVIYHHVAGHDEGLYMDMAKEYCHLNFFDPVANVYGHPIYPLFLALMGSLFSYSFYVIGIIQTILFSLCALMLLRELEIYTSKPLWGVLILLMVFPDIYFYNGYFTTESLAFSILLLDYGIAVRILNRGATGFRLFLLSVVVGITIMNRFEEVSCILPILFLIYPEIKVKLLRSALIIMFLPVCFLLINGLKNYKIYRVFRVTDFHAGETIYGGNNDNLDGSHHNFYVYRKIFIPKNKLADFDKLDSLPPQTRYPRLDSLFKQLSIQAWKDNPVNQLKVIPEKLAKIWLLPGNFDIYTNDTTKTKGLQITKLLNKKYFNNNPIAPYKHLFYIGIQWAFLLLIVIGIWNMDRKNRFQLSVLFLLVFYLFYTIPFCGLPRWHVTIFPILIMAFAPGWVVNKIMAFFTSKNRTAG